MKYFCVMIDLILINSVVFQTQNSKDTGSSANPILNEQTFFFKTQYFFCTILDSD